MVGAYVHFYDDVDLFLMFDIGIDRLLVAKP
jgi:hypothetical protein